MQIKNEKTFIKCRDNLIEVGLFEYRKGKKGSPNQYKINTVNFTVHSTVQTTVNNTVKSTVNVTDINRLDKDIYINLFNKYKRENRNDFGAYVKAVSKMKDDPDWNTLNWEQQQKLISEI